jgi:hypothetical protein
MRTLLMILSGSLLWAVCLAVARLLAGTAAGAMTVATGVFVALWLLAAGVNMWIGVSRAGYAFQEELPIFLLIFLLPVAVAVGVKWKFL